MIRVVSVIWICLLTMTTGSAAQGPYIRGYFYTNEEGFVQNNKEAYKRFRLAAEKGNADGQYNLGVMYRDGQGVAQDFKEAVKWYRLAANQGNDNAQFDLGAMYDKGQGVQDYKEAVKWYRLAAKQGNDNAQFNLGIMYRDGKGVPQDFIYSYMWMNIASANGYSFGENYRDTLAGEMTQQQIENAQELANKCMSTNYKDCD